MDFTKLTISQRITLAGGIIATIALFLPWRQPAPSADTVSSFDSGLLAWGGLLVTIAAAAIAVLRGLGKADVEIAGLAPEQVALTLGIVGLILILLRWLTGSGIRFGLFVGLAAGAVIVSGAWASLRDAGLSVPSLSRFLPGGRRSG